MRRLPHPHTRYVFIIFLSTEWLLMKACVLLGDKELVEFLADEIKSERKRASRIPSDFDGFTIKLDGSEMILTKIFEEER